MTCKGTSNLNTLVLIPTALTRMIKLYCRATTTLQNVGRSVDGSVTGACKVAFHFLGEMGSRDVLAGELRPAFESFCCGEK